MASPPSHFSAVADVSRMKRTMCGVLHVVVHVMQRCWVYLTDRSDSKVQYPVKKDREHSSGMPFVRVPNKARGGRGKISKCHTERSSTCPLGAWHPVLVGIGYKHIPRCQLFSTPVWFLASSGTFDRARATQTRTPTPPPPEAPDLPSAAHTST